MNFELLDQEKRTNDVYVRERFGRTKSGRLVGGVCAIISAISRGSLAVGRRSPLWGVAMVEKRRDADRSSSGVSRVLRFLPSNRTVCARRGMTKWPPIHEGPGPFSQCACHTLPSQPP